MVFQGIDFKHSDMVDIKYHEDLKLYNISTIGSPAMVGHREKPGEIQGCINRLFIPMGYQIEKLTVTCHLECQIMEDYNNDDNELYKQSSLDLHIKSLSITGDYISTNFINLTTEKLHVNINRGTAQFNNLT